MAKQKEKLDYTYATDPTEFDLRFYRRYDENFLYNKALALAMVLENEERFKAQAAEYQYIDLSRINDKFFESLRAEFISQKCTNLKGSLPSSLLSSKIIPIGSISRITRPGR